MKTTISELGKDKTGILWQVEVKDDKFESFHFVQFLPWYYGTKPSLRDTQAKELAQLKVESKTSAKLDEIKIDKRFENQCLGSLLIDFVERWALNQGIIELHGDIVTKDSDHFDKLRHFYEKNGWTFELFTETQLNELKSSTIVGRVFKKLI